MSDTRKIPVDQLTVGLYVILDLKWFEHPFAFNSFKIKSEEQIAAIRATGLKMVRYDPARSEFEAAATPNATLPAATPNATPTATATATPNATPNAPPTAPSPAPDPASSAPAPAAPRPPELIPTLAAKRALIERIRQQREAAARIENAFVDTAKTIRDIDKNLFAKPEETVNQATELVTQIAESILAVPELAIHAMADKIGGEELYFHSLNVTMLALMVARDIKLPQEVVETLGMGALFHDLGRREIPAKILMKLEPLNKVERDFYELHCQYGVDIAGRLKLSPAVRAIVQDHHEMYDGSGYPRRLKGEQVGLLARIVAMANHYDGLCNPVNLANALTPHEALSSMFTKLRAKFDPKLLQVFIRCLGVYPPGSIVQLSNGVVGMVATINATKPLKPMIVIYDEDVPKEEAILVDMDTATDVNIAKAIRPAQLPREIYNYLSPRKQISYYFDPGTRQDPAQAPR